MRANAGAKLKREITNYFAAETFYHDHAKRGRDAKLAHNTIIRPTWRDKGAPEKRERENGFEIVLHHTPILTFWSGGTLTLNSGGYQTVTTKARLNEVLQPLGLTIWQKKGQWYVAEFGNEKDALKFYDGMEIRVEFNHEHSLRSKGFLNRNGNQIAFDVFLRGKEIDTVFYSPDDPIEASEVKRALVNHDGYDPAITVRKRSGKDHGSRAEVRALAKKFKQNPSLKPATYGYRINLDERGLFSADVVEDDGHELYEVKSDPDAWDEIREVQDGWMRHARDLVGLTAYLVHLGTIARGSRVVTMPEAERAWKRK